MKTFTVCCIGAWLAGSAFAQPQWHIEVSNIITPEQPRATVSLRATFDPHDHAFAVALLGVRASEPGWMERWVLLPPPYSEGNVAGLFIRGITVGQIHFPPTVPANPANPILVYEAVWATDDFRPRLIDVHTKTSRFDVYISPTSPASQSRINSLAEGHARIQVVHGPSAAALLGIAMLGVLRRRRERPIARP
jgi:hypothetical protein